MTCLKYHDRINAKNVFTELCSLPGEDDPPLSLADAELKVGDGGGGEDGHLDGPGEEVAQGRDRALPLLLAHLGGLVAQHRPGWDFSSLFW